MRALQSTVSGCLAGALLLWGNMAAHALVIPLFSIADIPVGQTIDFEQSGGTANAILPSFNMFSVPDVSITTLTFPVTGNSAAPIENRALFGSGFEIENTGLPWGAIGLTGVGTMLGGSRTLELTAFDIHGTELRSVTRLFAPADTSFAAYNAAAVFLGLVSTTPIASILLTSNDPNVAWDNLRFSGVPEPSTLLLLTLGLAVLVAWRQRRERAGG